jgi:pyruvate/2-oxoglutarate dehydrogenase complex dihydrolipoamide dehydrogenase (E3) component
VQLVRINMAAVRERKRKMVQNLVDAHLDLYEKSGAELVMGMGRFVGPKTIEAELNGGGTRTFRGKNVVINTGSRATLEPIHGLAEVGPLTHIEALELDQIPKHLLVLGAGYVGLELAQAFRRFGAEVTLIDRNSRLAHHEDEDVSQGLEEMCRGDGINVVTSAIVTLVKGKSGEWIRLLGTRDGVELSLEGTHSAGCRRAYAKYQRYRARQGGSGDYRAGPREGVRRKVICESVSAICE